MTGDKRREQYGIEMRGVEALDAGGSHHVPELAQPVAPPMATELVHRAPEPHVCRNRHGDNATRADGSRQLARQRDVIIDVFEDIEGAGGVESRWQWLARFHLHDLEAAAPRH